jgi:hypothetical protein
MNAETAREMVDAVSGKAVPDQQYATQMASHHLLLASITSCARSPTGWTGCGDGRERERRRGRGSST